MSPCESLTCAVIGAAGPEARVAAPPVVELWLETEKVGSSSAPSGTTLSPSFASAEPERINDARRTRSTIKPALMLRSPPQGSLSRTVVNRWIVTLPPAWRTELNCARTRPDADGKRKSARISSYFSVDLAHRVVERTSQNELPADVEADQLGDPRDRRGDGVGLAAGQLCFLFFLYREAN